MELTLLRSARANTSTVTMIHVNHFKHRAAGFGFCSTWTIGTFLHVSHGCCLLNKQINKEKTNVWKTNWESKSCTCAKQCFSLEVNETCLEEEKIWYLQKRREKKKGGGTDWTGKSFPIGQTFPRRWDAIYNR